VAGSPGPLRLIEPDWPAPPGVRAVATTRAGGCSTGAWAGLNLGDHVGDHPAAVAANRALLAATLTLPASPCWLRQVHGTRIVTAALSDLAPEADGSMTRLPGQVCAVLTADCLPVLLCDAAGRHVAAVHAGWRGLAAGILEQAVTALRAAGARELLAWLGPAISGPAYEVGAEVRDAFLASQPASATAFTPTRPGHWHLDLYTAARQRLTAAGVSAIYGGTRCTRGEPGNFYSHRRDHTTGRQATLIWLER
jgi:YfiH family protein